MTLELDRPVTDATLWSGAVALLAIDLALLPLVHRFVPTSRFIRLRHLLPIASAAFWTVLWLWVVATFWRSVYSFVFPEALRWLLPPAFGLLFALASLLLFRVALHANRYASLTFVLLGAVLGPLTHLVAVWRGVVTKPPLMSGASPVAAIAISFPEFALYWSAILLLALALSRITGDHQEEHRAAA